MAAETSGITNTQVTARPSNPNEFYVTWDSTYVAKYHQVYINGRIAHVSSAFNEPYSLLLRTERIGLTLVFIIAVDEDDRLTDYSDLFATEIANGARVTIRFAPEAIYGLNAQVNIYNDNKTGTVDYDNPINEYPIEMFPQGIGQGGFGMSSFGYGGFGYDIVSPGFGMGNFGFGEWGYDRNLIEYITDWLSNGTWKFGVKALDKYGNESENGTEDTVAISAYPRSAKRLQVASSDGTNITFSWTESPDI